MNRIRQRYALRLATLCFIFCILSLTNVSAQSQAENRFYGIIINPTLNFLELDPGESYTGKILLTNDMENIGSVTLHPIAVLFEESEELEGSAKFIFNEELPPSADAASWVTFQENSYTLGPKQTGVSTFTITVPADAEAGGHYVALVYPQDQITRQEAASSVDPYLAVSSLVFITVKGEVIETGELLAFYPGKPIYDFLPVDLHIDYKNNGNVHNVIGGNIFVHQGDLTKPNQTITVNKNERLTLPGNKRTYTEYYVNSFLQYDENGNFTVKTENFPTLPFGRYWAILKLRHTVNGQRITTTAETSFWVIPWQLIVLVLMIIGSIYYYIRRRRRYSVKYVKSSKIARVRNK